MNLFQNNFIRRQIGVISNLSHEGLVGKIVVIIGIIANVKKTVFPVPERLMYLKVKAN
jgi:hypothetical protein